MKNLHYYIDTEIENTEREMKIRNEFLNDNDNDMIDCIPVKVKQNKDIKWENSTPMDGGKYLIG